MNLNVAVEEFVFDDVPKSARSLLLLSYYQMLPSARTVDETKRLHNAIVKHLSDEICSLYEESIPEHLRQQAAAVLESWRKEHAAAVTDLKRSRVLIDSLASPRHADKLPKSVRSLRFEWYFSRLGDVHNVEEAIELHTEIMTELAAELQAMENVELPVSFKAQAVADLELRREQHAKAVGRLTGLLQRGEQAPRSPNARDDE